MKNKKKCPRCNTSMEWVERASKNFINIGTFECWKCQKIIAGHQMPGKEPEETIQHINPNCKDALQCKSHGETGEVFYKN